MTANTGDGFWRWLWQSYNQTSEEALEAVYRWLNAKWYRMPALGLIEALTFGGLWWIGAL